MKMCDDRTANKIAWAVLAAGAYARHGSESIAIDVADLLLASFNKKIPDVEAKLEWTNAGDEEYPVWHAKHARSMTVFRVVRHSPKFWKVSVDKCKSMDDALRTTVYESIGDRSAEEAMAHAEEYFAKMILPTA